MSRLVALQPWLQMAATNIQTWRHVTLLQGKDGQIRPERRAQRQRSPPAGLINDWWSQHAKLHLHSTTCYARLGALYGIKDDIIYITWLNLAYLDRRCCYMSETPHSAHYNRRLGPSVPGCRSDAFSAVVHHRTWQNNWTSLTRGSAHHPRKLTNRIVFCLCELRITTTYK